MAKKKKGSKAKPKNPLPKEEPDQRTVHNDDNVEDNVDIQLENDLEEDTGDTPAEDEEQAIPARSKDVETQPQDDASREGTDQDESDHEKDSTEYVDIVPKGKQADQLVEEQSGLGDDEDEEVGRSGSNSHDDDDIKESTGKYDNDQFADEMGSKTDRDVPEEAKDEQDDVNKNIKEQGVEPSELETTIESDEVKPTDLDLETHENHKDIELKQGTEHLKHHEFHSNPRNLSALAMLEPKVSEGVILSESNSELQLNTLNQQSVDHENSPTPKIIPTKLIRSSKGPYSLHDILTDIPLYNPDIEDSENAFPTYIEKLDDHIYIGTSHGEILHFFKIGEDFILVSRSRFHQSRIRPITKIVLLPKIEKALVLAGGLLSCFLLPEFAPANIGRIKDVNDVSLDFDNKAKNDANGVHVAVYTSNQIRIINVTSSALRLVKDISYPDSMKGLRRSEYSLVASRENYDLIDLENFQKIPLFPILTVKDESGENPQSSLKPFILPVGQDEFLLTCGISRDEPSMGLVINLNGDISRGTIPLPKYPDSLGVDYPYVLSTFDNSIVIDSLHDQSEVQTMEFSDVVKLSNVSSSFTQPYMDLVDLIKLIPLVGEDNERELEEKEFVSKISMIDTSLICYCSSFVKMLLPEPRLIRLINSSDIESLKDELNFVNGSTELGVIELEYINLLIGLTYLKNRSYTQGSEIWTSGTVDPRILIYIFKYKAYGSVWIFNGLRNLVEEIRNGIKESNFRKFFKLFLDKWIARESYTENEDIVRSIELANLKESLDDDDRIMRIVKRDIKLTLDETIEILKENGRYIALAKIYTKHGKHSEVLEIYKDLEDGKKKDSLFKKNDGLTIIIDLVYKYLSKDEDLIWDVGLWLINKKPELGLNFLQNERLNIKIKDETELISKIDDISLKYKYAEKLLVRLNKDKMRTNLIKNLQKSQLKCLNESIRTYKSHLSQ